MDDTNDWDVLIVDNGSTDGTADFVRSIASEWESGYLRLVEEPEAGLSHARNRALRESESEIVAFIDDDSAVCPQWLSEIREMFARHPRAAVVGGPIHVQWLDDKPAWLHPDLLSYFSEVDYGPDDCQLIYPRYPYGANFCVRREVALSISGFRAELGYSGASLIGGEEIDVARRLEEKGWQIWYCARASVRHLISGKRASLGWLTRRAYGSGITETLLQKERLHGFGRIRQCVEDLRWLRYAAMQRRLSDDSSEAARREVRYWCALGRCRGWWIRTSGS